MKLSNNPDFTERVLFEDFEIPGDDNRIVQLKTALDKFTPFATESTGKGQPRFTDEGETTPPKPGRYGYLRNMLINTKVIKLNA